jgi:hypothetical protein
MGVPSNADVSAALSALMYDISGQEVLEGMTLREAVNSNNVDLSPSMVAIINENNLGDVVILDHSWRNDQYRTANGGNMNAATVQLPNGDIHVAFHGTGDYNWEQNTQAFANSAHSEMQRLALEYFDRSVGIHANNGAGLYVTGHSQGGNNAMYVMLFSQFGYRINACTSLDGSGFNAFLTEEARRLWGEAYFESQLQVL